MLFLQTRSLNILFRNLVLNVLYILFRNLVLLPDVYQVNLKENNTTKVYLFSAANRDPLGKIMGPAFIQVSTNDNALLKAHETLLKSQTSGNASEVEELENRFRLMLLINQLDVQLLSSSVEHMAK